MKRLSLNIALVLVLAATGYGQTFEVASIRVNKTDDSGKEGRRINVEATPGSLTMRNVTLLSCIRWAYNVHDYQISGGPNWRDSERYDIIAKPAAAVSEDQMRLMLRALLADRFKLMVGSETRELPVYVMNVGKNGHRMQRSKTDGPRTMGPAAGGLAFKNASMSDLELFLNTAPGIDRPVLDRTGLEGAFDFALIIFDSQIDDAAGAKRAAVSAGSSTFADALDRIGLRLESTKLPTEMITITHAEKPSEN
jgi:uncharacterized protein (TIGR03435 family)